jgi:hypothetical protein
VHIGKRHVTLDDRHVHIDKRHVTLDESHVHIDKRHVTLDESHVHIDKRHVPFGSDRMYFTARRRAVRRGFAHCPTVIPAARGINGTPKKECTLPEGGCDNPCDVPN